MYLVRPVDNDDLAALEALAALSTPGVHTLPKTPEKIAAAVAASRAACAATVLRPGEEAYLFVLEKLADHSLAGSAAIHAAAGSDGTYFSFRNDTIQQVSRDLNIAHSVHALTLCSELTGYSQLSGFHLHRGIAVESGGAGVEAALLSRARLLFAARQPERFGNRFFVALPGVTDAAGGSPFWDALGRKFFQMDFLAAERVLDGARNRTLIVELMPHYPVYVPLLPPDAQAVMGQIHPHAALALRLLREEGFEADQHIDIFDGGPILQAHKNALRSFNASLRRTVAAREEDAESGAELDAAPGELVNYAIAAGAGQAFRAVALACAPLESGEEVGLAAPLRDALQVAPGDSVICVRI